MISHSSSVSSQPSLSSTFPSQHPPLPFRGLSRLNRVDYGRSKIKTLNPEPKEYNSDDKPQRRRTVSALLFEIGHMSTKEYSRRGWKEDHTKYRVRFSILLSCIGTNQRTEVVVRYFILVTCRGWILSSCQLPYLETNSPLTELPPPPLPILALHPVLVNLYQFRVLVF